MEQLWPIIASVLGGGGIATVAIQEFFKWRSGQAALERKENLSLVQRTQYAEEVAEWADTARRKTAEHASWCRRVAIDHGATLEDLGPWPAISDRPPKPGPSTETT